MKSYTKQQNQNHNPNRTLPRMQQFSEVNKLPANIRSILIQNKVLYKQNQILKEELLMKKRIIQQLKQQIDQTIIEDTKDKLHYIRIIQNQVQEKTQKVLSEYYQNFSKFQDNIKNHQNQLKAMQNQLKKQRKMNKILAQNVVELKQYIIQAMDQKDHIIEELKQIIVNISNNQNQNQSTDAIFENKASKPYIINTKVHQKRPYKKSSQQEYIRIEQNAKNQQAKVNKKKVKPKIIQNS